MMFAALMALAVLGFAGIGTIAAQDASPQAAACVSPGLPEGTPTPIDDGAEDMASPEAMEGMNMATPEAVEAPAGPVLPEGTPADAGVAGVITSAIENYAACYNEGQATGDPGLYVALESDNYWLSSSGSSNPHDRAAGESEGPVATAQLISVSNPMTYEDGRISGDAELLLNDHWFRHTRYFLTLSGDMTWLVDEEAYLRPSPDADSVSVVGINITETTDESTGQVTYAFEFTGGSTTFTQSEALAFTVSNSGAELHEAVVVQLPEGADPMGVLDGSAAFEDVVFYGAVAPIFPGETKELVLLNMEPGTYTLLCFFPGPDGAPHAANGMIAQFEIVALAE
jgi:uncharacterized cupredoxin-like copper-binding protein